MKVDLAVTTLADARASRPVEQDGANDEFRRTLDSVDDRRKSSIDRSGRPDRSDRQDDAEPKTRSAGEESEKTRSPKAEAEDAKIEALPLELEGLDLVTASEMETFDLAEFVAQTTDAAEVEASVVATTTPGTTADASVATGNEGPSASVTDIKPLGQESNAGTPSTATGKSTPSSPTATTSEGVDDNVEANPTRLPRDVADRGAPGNTTTPKRTVLEHSESTRVSDPVRSLAGGEAGTGKHATNEAVATSASATEAKNSSSKSASLKSVATEFHLTGNAATTDATAKETSAAAKPVVETAPVTPDATATAKRTVSEVEAAMTNDTNRSEARVEGAKHADPQAIDRSSVRGVVAAESRSVSESAPIDAAVKDDPLDETQLARRVSRLVRRSLSSGSGVVRIQIDPPNLGRVQIRFDVRDDKVGLQLDVENDDVRQILDRHVEELRSVLSSFGRADAEVSVDIQQGQSETFGESGGHSNGQEGGTDFDDANEVVTLTLDGVHLGRNVDVSS